MATAQLALVRREKGGLYRVEQGNNIDVLKRLIEEGVQVDAIVTDPPYGLKFMNKRWDYDVPSVDFWRFVLDVLKPGGHVLSFGGTRTYHRMVVNLEDAGFEIRDQLCWLYGSGFPKSMDVSKAIDKAAGAEREVLGTRASFRPSANATRDPEGFQDRSDGLVTAPATPEAIAWQGWGTALKPAMEPIVLARKPLTENTVATNVLEHGTGAINIDGCRLSAEGNVTFTRTAGDRSREQYRTGTTNGAVESNLGRWPANVLLDETAAAMLDEQTGERKGSHPHSTKRSGTKEIEGAQYHGGYSGQDSVFMGYADSGGASRFFYCAKASKKERRDSKHPTVKPVALMRYLCRLITPPKGIVLDPFAGTGATGEAAVLEGFKPILIELEGDYIKDIERRMEDVTKANQTASLDDLFEDDEDAA